MGNIDPNKTCRNCENLRQTQEGEYWCEITGARINSLKKLPKYCKRNTSNCHNYCRYGKYCRYAEGSIGMNPEECAMYYKIDDLMMDASFMGRHGKEEEEDW